jgi:cytoskeletal protein RodZ
MTNFGASFKQARESKGISLDQIASETRISTRFLRAIEAEEFHLLPGGIFNRGFVRAYAEKVGLDPDQAVAEYERLAEDRPAEGTPDTKPEPEKKQHRLYPIAIGALILLIIVFYVVTRESGHTAQTASTPAAPATTATNPPPSPSPAPAAETPTTPPAAVEPAPAKPEVTPPSPPPAAPTVAPAPAPAPSAQAITLDLEAHEETWIKVITDGTSADAGEILAPGTTRKFTAQNKMEISIGNAGGVAMKLNDKAMKAVGKSGQVRTIKITPDTIKDLTQ